MKKYKIQLNARAYRDLEEIFEYIANDLQSPEYAKGQTDRLWKSLKTLEIFPSSHQERLVGNYAGKGYRQLLIDNYLAIFKIDEQRKIVKNYYYPISRKKFIKFHLSNPNHNNKM